MNFDILQKIKVLSSISHFKKEYKIRYIYDKYLKVLYSTNLLGKYENERENNDRIKFV